MSITVAAGNGTKSPSYNLVISDGHAKWTIPNLSLKSLPLGAFPDSARVSLDLAKLFQQSKINLDA
jgi:hypothetical protein